MPRIPEASGEVQINSAPSLRNTTQAGPEAFGALTGRALQQVGNVGQQMAAEMQQRENVAQVQQAFLGASSDLQKYLHDADNGVLNRQGVNAKDSYDEVLNKLPEISDKYTTGLSNAQRRLFEIQWAQSTAPELRGVMRHVAAQTITVQSETAKAVTELNISSTTLNPGEIETYLPMIESSVRQEAHLRGVSLTVQQLMTQEAVTRGVAGAVETLLTTKDYDAAEAMVAKYGERMQPKLVQKLQNDIKVRKLDAEVQTESDLIMAKDLSYEDSLKAAREFEDPDKRTQVEQMVKTMYRDKMIIEEQKNADTYDKGYIDIYNSKSRSGALQIANRQTDLKVRRQLLAVVDQKHPIVQAGSIKLTDEQKDAKTSMERIRNSAMTLEIAKEFDRIPGLPKDEASLRLMCHNYGVYDKTYQDKVIEQVQGEGKYKDYSKSKILSTLQEMGLGETFKKVGDVPYAMQDALVDAAQDNKAPLGPREMTNVINGYLTTGQVKEPGMIYGTNKVSREWGEFSASGQPQTDFDWYAKQTPEAQKEATTIVKALNQWEADVSDRDADPVDTQTINSLFRSDLPGATEETYNAKQDMEFVKWVKAQKKLSYRDESGASRVKVITPIDLQSEKFWYSMKAYYENLRSQRVR